ncbi:MAG: hypothetical protein AAB439_03595 [Patescibacteria group bacterium]
MSLLRGEANALTMGRHRVDNGPLITVFGSIAAVALAALTVYAKGSFDDPVEGMRDSNFNTTTPFAENNQIKPEDPCPGTGIFPCGKPTYAGLDYCLECYEKIAADMSGD